jgi:hypothetical protein
LRKSYVRKVTDVWKVTDVCAADSQTHRSIVASAFVAIFIITMLGAAVISKFEQQPALSSIAVLRAGIPVATTDRGYFIVR